MASYYSPLRPKCVGREVQECLHINISVQVVLNVGGTVVFICAPHSCFNFGNNCFDLFFSFHLTAQVEEKTDFSTVTGNYGHARLTVTPEGRITGEWGDQRPDFYGNMTTGEMTFPDDKMLTFTFEEGSKLIFSDGQEWSKILEINVLYIPTQNKFSLTIPIGSTVGEIKVLISTRLGGIAPAALVVFYSQI